MEILIGEYEDSSGKKKYFVEPQYITLFKNRSSYKHYREGQYNKYPLLMPYYQYIFQEEYRIIKSLMFSKFIRVFNNILIFFIEYNTNDWLYVYKKLSKKSVVNIRLLKRNLINDEYKNLIVHSYRINQDFLIKMLNDNNVKEKLKESGINGVEQGMFLDFLLMMKESCKGEDFDDDVNRLFNKIAIEYDINKIEPVKIKVVNNGK